MTEPEQQMQPSARNPVLLVHGLDDTSVKLARLEAYLQARGWSPHTIDLWPSDGSLGIEALAEQVQSLVNSYFDPAQSLDLVGYSMGGIVSRYYLQRLGGLSRVQRLVTVASPHYGTYTGYLRPNLGAQQMRWGSPFLANLNRDMAQLQKIRFTSIWTPLDLMIVPAESSCLPVGRQVQVLVPLHHWMVEDPLALGAIAAALEEPLATSYVSPTRL
ncbi:MAG: triacylglycerol lipase [Cyanobacteria bacterium P01_A01_bin.135]